MTFDQSDKTKNFITAVKELVENGTERSYTKIAESIDWNKTALSQVLAGTRNVPNVVYKRFADIYGAPKQDHISSESEDQSSIQERYISLLETTLRQREAEVKQVKEDFQEWKRHFTSIQKKVEQSLAYSKICLLILERVLAVAEKEPLKKIQADTAKLLTAYKEQFGGLED